MSAIMKSIWVYVYAYYIMFIDKIGICGCMEMGKYEL